MRKAIRLLASLLVIALTTLALHASETPVAFENVQLTDGRTLKNVVVKSYDAKTGKILIIADRKALSVPLSAFPASYHDQLKNAPQSGSTISTVPQSPAPLPMIATQPARIVVTPISAPPIIAYPSAVSAAPTKPPPHPDYAPGGLVEHQGIARKRAESFFRYEIQLGSNSISVTSLDLQLDVPKEVAGWGGRFRTEGKAFIEYFDSVGRAYRRTTSTFEVTTEQKPGEEIKVVDFSRKT